MSSLEKIYRIFDSIQPDKNGCHVYPSLITSQYVIIKINDKQFKTSRIALERKLGRLIKSGYCALHTCDRKQCVNPEHLYEGTKKDNAQDRSRRNQKSWDWMRGINNPWRKMIIDLKNNTRKF